VTLTVLILTPAQLARLQTIAAHMQLTTKEQR
jgi:hypothetical protein